MTTKLIYVAGPFSGKSRDEINLNIEAARQCGKLLASKGWMPVIPHANTAGFDVLLPDVPYEFWLEGTLLMMEKCSAVFFCPGWEKSTGSKAEHVRAIEIGLPLYFTTVDVPDIRPVLHITGYPETPLPDREAASMEFLLARYARISTSYARQAFDGHPFTVACQHYGDETRKLLNQYGFTVSQEANPT